MSLYFVTGNKNKFSELQRVIPSIQQQEMEVEEIQSLNPQVVIEHKLEQVRLQLDSTSSIVTTSHEHAYIVEDTSLEIPALGGLPGPLIKWFLQAVGGLGVAEMVLATGKAAAVAHTWLGYMDTAGKVQFFHGSVPGTIVMPRGESGFGWDPIFIPQGSEQTFAELGPDGKFAYNMRRMAAEQLAEFLAA